MVFRYTKKEINVRIKQAAKYAGKDKVDLIENESQNREKDAAKDELSGDVNGDVNGNVNGDVNNDENRVMQILKKQPDITVRDIRAKTGFSTRKISRIVKKLRESGKIIRVGSDKKGY